MSFLELFFNRQEPGDAVLLPPTEFLVAVINKSVQLVDVRPEKEYSDEHITGAININWLEPFRFKRKIGKLNKKEPIYVYCRTGSRSQDAAKKLVALGFAEVYYLDGGITAIK